jgi:hypothetical protein
MADVECSFMVFGSDGLKRDDGKKLQPAKEKQAKVMNETVRRRLIILPS